MNRGQSGRRSGVIFFICLVVFLILNAAKVDIIDRLVASSQCELPAAALSFKFFVYISLLVFIYLAALRLGNSFVLVFLYAAQGAYLFVHLVYFFYFRTHFHIHLVLQFFEGLSLARHGSVPVDIRYLIILMDLPFWCVLVFYRRRLRALLVANSKKVRLWMVSSLAAFILSAGASFWIYRVPQLLDDPLLPEAPIIARCGLLVNDLAALFSYPGAASAIRGIDYGAEREFPGRPAGSPSNIICVQVESLDANAVDLAYNGRQVMPFLHALSSTCLYYPSIAYLSGPGATSGTEFAVLNGAAPPDRFPVSQLKSYDFPNALPKVLARAGYAAQAFHNNLGSFYGRDSSFVRMGFQKFNDVIAMGLPSRGWGASDGDVMAYVKRRLAPGTPEPFFYYIITMSSHYPFKSARGYYRNSHYDGMGDTLVEDYLNAMSYVDEVLKDLVLFVRDRVPNTSIFIYGDHIAHSLYGRLFDIDRGVPLFIVGPEGESSRRGEEGFSLLDVHPTILAATGISARIRTRGRDLSRPPYFRQGSQLPG